MFDWTREQAPVAKAAGIPVLSQEEMKQVSGAGFLLTEDGFLLTEDGFLLTEDGFLLTED
ncbi:MAG TPA: hypothetical protein PLA97_09150 [Rubrivivax sp.]|nr:hypothetical protein [Rubrivivax sp.]